LSLFTQPPRREKLLVEKVVIRPVGGPKTKPKTSGNQGQNTTKAGF
jgi:hypothetical protein